MEWLPTYSRRSTAILKMSEAVSRGQTVAGFIRELEASTGTYRRTVMLADWRSVAGIEAKKDLIKYVRKDRMPSTRVIADVTWNLSKEYLYKLRAWSRVSPDKPLTEHFINIMSDVPLTVAEIERQAFLEWDFFEKYRHERLTGVTVLQVLHRIPSPLNGE